MDKLTKRDKISLAISGAALLLWLAFKIRSVAVSTTPQVTINASPWDLTNENGGLPVNGYPGFSTPVDTTQASNYAEYLPLFGFVGYNQ